MWTGWTRWTRGCRLPMTSLLQRSQLLLLGGCRRGSHYITFLLRKVEDVR